MVKRTICFVNGTSPRFNGGITNYQKNLINYIKNKNLDITWLYKSNKNENYLKEGIKYVGLRCSKIMFIDDISFNIKAKRYLDKNYFDVINSHAIWGYWMKNYRRQNLQKLIHTYHGATYPYYKVHLKRFGIIKRILISPLLLYGYLIEKYPIKKADKIICVSEKVKRQLRKTYDSNRNLQVLRTGVNLNEFKVRNKNEVRKMLKLDKNKTYGLYIGKGGYWIKGLDRAIKISQKIHDKYKEYRMIIVGAEYNKIKDLIKKEFIIYHEMVPREKINYYYNASDFLFYLSRYDGGAPTLVVSEAMASGCPIVFSKDSEQEIIKNGENGIVIDEFGGKEAQNIINILKDNKNKEKIIKNSLKTINKISLEKWGRKYLEILLK
jgi:glycosyltransferase involved in cell wall biosynthesis